MSSETLHICSTCVSNHCLSPLPQSRVPLRNRACWQGVANHQRPFLMGKPFAVGKTMEDQSQTAFLCKFIKRFMTSKIWFPIRNGRISCSICLWRTKQVKWHGRCGNSHGNHLPPTRYIEAHLQRSDFSLWIAGCHVWQQPSPTVDCWKWTCFESGEYWW